MANRNFHWKNDSKFSCDFQGPCTIENSRKTSVYAVRQFNAEINFSKHYFVSVLDYFNNVGWVLYNMTVCQYVSTV